MKHFIVPKVSFARWRGQDVNKVATEAMKREEDLRQKQEGSGCRAECRPFLRHLAGLTPVLRHMNKNMPGTLGLLLSVLHSPGRLLRGNRKRVFPNEKAAISWSFVPQVCKPKQHLNLTQMDKASPSSAQGPAWEGHRFTGWSKETKQAICAFRFGRDQECEILSRLALPSVASALSPLGSGVRRR